MVDLTAAVLAAITERREIAEAEVDARDGNAYYAGDYAREYETTFGPVPVLAALGALEVITRRHVRTKDDPAYCDCCTYSWPCPDLETVARLFLTAEQLAAFGVLPVCLAGNRGTS